MDAQGQIPVEASAMCTLTTLNVNTGKYFGTQNTGRRILSELLHHRTAVGALTYLGLASLLYFSLLSTIFYQLQFISLKNLILNSYYMHVCTHSSKCTYMYLEKDVVPQGNKYARGKHAVYTKGLTRCHGDLIHFFLWI